VLQKPPKEILKATQSYSLLRLRLAAGPMPPGGAYILGNFPEFLHLRRHIDSFPLLSFAYVSYYAHET